MNSILHGYNPLEHVVAVQQLNDQFVRIYRRTPSALASEDQEFFPFFFLADDTLLSQFPHRHWIKRLDGDNYYAYLAAFRRWGDMWEAAHYCLRAHNERTRTRAANLQSFDLIHLRPDPVHQFLLQSGITLFKSMTFEKLKRVQVDVQAVARDRQRSDANRRDDRIVVATVTTADGAEYAFDGLSLDEPALLGKFLQLLRDLDPDVIEGHDLFGRILPYLVRRLELHGLEFRLGRDASVMRRTSRQDSDWSVFEIAGRHLVDTIPPLESYDFARKSLEQYRLPYLAEQFKVAQQGRIDLLDHEVTKAWREDARSLIDFSLQNSRDTRSILNILSPSSFFLAQMCPYNYGTLTRLGSAAKLESLLMREYIRVRHSVPRPEAGKPVVGGYTDVFATGVFENVWYVDVESLYPSIMLSRGIGPGSDQLKVWPTLLSELTDLRIQAKRRSQQAHGEAERSQEDTLQSAFKILINSFYGYLAYFRGLFNDYEQADAITRAGQEILRSIIHQIELFNGRIIEVDTDGIYFIPPDNIAGLAAESAFIERLSNVLPNRIRLVLAGRYKKMLSYKKKNYALLDEDERMTIRGSSLSSRGLERFARTYIQRCIECLLRGDVSGLHQTYVAARNQIERHRWLAADFCRTETLRDSLETYEREVASEKRNVGAGYEVVRRAGIYVKAGTSVSYYVTGSDANVKIADNARIAEEWDANLPDENTAYYLARLSECSAKFRDFFLPEDFEKIFSSDDLFGFSDRGITILSKKAVSEGERPDEGVDAEDEPGIWLDGSKKPPSPPPTPLDSLWDK